MDHLRRKNMTNIFFYNSREFPENARLKKIPENTCLTNNYIKSGTHVGATISLAPQVIFFKFGTNTSASKALLETNIGNFKASKVLPFL